MSVQLLWELHALFSEGVYKPLVGPSACECLLYGPYLLQTLQSHFSPVVAKCVCELTTPDSLTSRSEASLERYLRSIDQYKVRGHCVGLLSSTPFSPTVAPSCHDAAGSILSFVSSPSFLPSSFYPALTPLYAFFLQLVEFETATNKEVALNYKQPTSLW